MRHRMSKHHSRKNFTKHAKRVHPKNQTHTVMRGGYRL